MKIKKGFTLIELMVVISVIAILATIALFGFGKAQAGARDVQRSQMMNGIQAALVRYYGDKGSYPVSGSLFPNGATLCCSNFFNGMTSILAEYGYLSNIASTFKDPLKGAIYTTYGGADRYVYAAGWAHYAQDESGCGFSGWGAQPGSATALPEYNYWSDGQTYELCLKKESGGVQEFKSPQ